MKVKELIERLSKLDPERGIWIGYDFPHDIQTPHFVEYEEFQDYSPSRRIRELIKEGDYIHYAE